MITAEGLLSDNAGDDAAGDWHLGLRDRRRRQRRLPARQPAVRRPCRAVLLLEAGGQDDWFWIDIPVGYLYTIANPRTDWCYKTAAGRAPRRPLDPLRARPRARRLLSINAMIYMRGQKEDYDHWASLGNAGWSWDDVLPLFKKVEDYQHGADEMHGAGGELRVEEPRVRWEILDAWRDGGRRVRHPEDSGVQPGRQLRQRVFPDEPEARRALERDQSLPAPGAAAAEPDRAHAGARRTRADRDDATALRADGRRVRASARRPVLRSGRRARRSWPPAAIGSPQTLQLSGIGAGRAAPARGIAPVHDLAGVGENLHDHLQIRMQYKVKNTVRR